MHMPLFVCRDARAYSSTHDNVLSRFYAIIEEREKNGGETAMQGEQEAEDRITRRSQYGAERIHILP